MAFTLCDFYLKKPQIKSSIECRSCCRRKSRRLLEEKKNRRLFNEIEPNASMNVAAAVAEKDVDSLEEKNIVVCA